MLDKTPTINYRSSLAPNLEEAMSTTVLSDEELLELLKTDVRKFNKYREENTEQEICFRTADFSNADLSEANLSQIDLRYALLDGARLYGADFNCADLTGTRLRNALYINGASFGNAIMSPESREVVLACLRESIEVTD